MNANECVSLAECIRIALDKRSELVAAMHLRESEYLKLAATRKGLGFRTDVALSAKRQDQDVALEDALATGRVTRYQNNELLNIKQTFPWGTTVDLYLNNNLTNSDNDQFDQLADNAFSCGASIQQDLFIPSLLQLDILEAEARLDASQASLEYTKRQIIFEVSEAYYNYLRAYQIRDVRQKALQIARSLSDLATKQFEKGVSIDVGLLEASVSHSLAEANMQEATLGIEVEGNSLWRALEQEFGMFEICPVYEKKTWPIPEKTTLEAMLRRNPSLEVLKNQIVQLEVERRREKRNFQKSLVLEANIDRNVYGRGFEKVAHNDQYDQTWSVGMTFNIPLWDNGVNRNKVNAIEYQIKNLTATISANYQSLALDLGNTLDALKRLNSIISTLDRARRYAEKNLELMNAQFARGLNSVNDVVRAEQNLTNTRLSMINSIIEYNINIFRLFLLTGHERLSPLRVEQ